MLVEVGPEAAGELGHHLEKEYPPCFEEIVSLWKQATSTKSPELKYLLLYRLMEFLFEGDSKTQEITSWIQGKEPSVPMYPPYSGKNYITVYTHLRHRIYHPRGEPFPHTEINNALPKLWNLVRKAIKERCGVNYA